MKSSLRHIVSGIVCTALTIGLTLPAQGAEAPPIRVSSCKGNTLEIVERSSLIISPCGAKYTVTSRDPDTVAVEQVLTFWVAVAKGEGSAEITAINSTGEHGTLTLAVGTAVPTIPTTPASEDSASSTDESDVRLELVRLINQARIANGAAELPVSEALIDAAQDCAEQGFEDHDAQYECKATLRHSYPYGFGSNLTVFTYNCNTDIAQRAVSHWTYSPRHFQTMTAERFDSLGVGVALHDGTAYCYMFVGNSGGINPYA